MERIRDSDAEAGTGFESLPNGGFLAMPCCQCGALAPIAQRKQRALADAHKHLMPCFAQAFTPHGPEAPPAPMQVLAGNARQPVHPSE